jgi:5-methylcytosine-specific restriction endonuclease McrA
VCSRICASKADVDDFLANLKITPCPHCKKTGFLNRHGALIGYSLNQMGSAIRAARAVRVYCSNRHLASGCGRTFSVWTADKIKHLFLSAESLWLFLNQAVCSGNKLQAFRTLNCGLSDSATYHIWRRFLNAQVAIRTALLALCEPPQLNSEYPATLTLEHLAKAFHGHKLSPIAAFAATLQSFFI